MYLAEMSHIQDCDYCEQIEAIWNVFSVTLTGIISLMSHLGRRQVFTLGEGILNLGLPSLAGMHLTMWKT